MFIDAGNNRMRIIAPAPRGRQLVDEINCHNAIVIAAVVYCSIEFITAVSVPIVMDIDGRAIEPE